MEVNILHYQQKEQIVTISKSDHIKHMVQEFSPDELIKIIAWIDPIISKPQSDIGLEGVLVDLFKKIPANKKTKSFVYQILVLNGIINDGIHDKDYCNQSKHCRTLKYAKEEYNIDDKRLLCNNLKICLLIPGINIDPPFDSTTELTKLTIN